MTFKHELLPRHEMTHENGANGRQYITPIGPLPSVTTVIGRAMDKTGLRKWRADIGDDEADQILCQSQVRGREVHNLCERYVMNNPDWRAGVMPVNMETFNQIKEEIDDHLNTVYGIELPLWSKILQTAGTADLVCEWDGQPAIVDYKTSRKLKSETQCLGYMIQGTVYALMVFERYGIIVPNVVVILTVDHENIPLVYKVRTSKYWCEARDIFITNREKVHEVV